jgi:replication-associated recombination protein RarA
MASDFEILRQAYQREEDVRNKKLLPYMTAWERSQVGATLDQVKRLVDEGMITVEVKNGNLVKYKLIQKGRDLVYAEIMERKMKKVEAPVILKAMDLIVGFDDLKMKIAKAIASGKRTHFLLSGPPACAKSLILEAVRTTVDSAYMAFGSRTSSSGLSDVLFEHHPTVLLLDEADKIRMDTFSVLLGLMQTGEILETKTGKTRGVRLETMVIAACNRYEKMPPEFMSRFAMHAAFPKYTRDEFIDVCKGFLPRVEKTCSVELAEMIGKAVFDYNLGDVRKARGVFDLMDEQTPEEVARVVDFMMKYSPDGATRHKRVQGAKLL